MLTSHLARLLLCCASDPAITCSHRRAVNPVLCCLLKAVSPKPHALNFAFVSVVYESTPFTALVGTLCRQSGVPGFYSSFIRFHVPFFLPVFGLFYYSTFFLACEPCLCCTIVTGTSLSVLMWSQDVSATGQACPSWVLAPKGTALQVGGS